MEETLIENLSWGRIEVKIGGQIHRFKDCKVWPGDAREWRWAETGTHHDPGIQLADIEEILAHNLEVVVFGCGQLGRLKVSAETETMLRERSISYHVEKTGKAVTLFNDLARQGKRVGGVFHSTC